MSDTMDKDELEEYEQLMHLSHKVLSEANENLHQVFVKLGLDEAFFEVTVSLRINIDGYETKIYRKDGRVDVC